MFIYSALFSHERVLFELYYRIPVVYGHKGDWIWYSTPWIVYLTRALMLLLCCFSSSRNTKRLLCSWRSLVWREFISWKWNSHVVKKKSHLVGDKCFVIFTVIFIRLYNTLDDLIILYWFYCIHFETCNIYCRQINADYIVVTKYLIYKP